MEDKRFYIIVPQTVQVVHKGLDIPKEQRTIEDWSHPEIFEDSVESFPMVHGRLMAQCVHVGRLLGHHAEALKIPYTDVTTITLVVRNSKELKKVSKEIHAQVSYLNIANHDSILYKEFHDENPLFYNTMDRVHTITAVGPVSREELEDAIGHLELY